MTNPSDGLSARDIWEVIIHVGPILVGLLVATLKLMRVLDQKIAEHASPIVSALHGVEVRLSEGLKALWEHEQKQDEALAETKEKLFTLKGEHDAMLKMGGRRVCDPPTPPPMMP